MAISLTQAQLSAAIRLGDSPEEVAESTRLLAFATEAISRHLGDAYDGAPETIVNEAAIRLAGYFYDQPNAGPGLVFCKRGPEFGRVGGLAAFQGSPRRINRRRCSSGARGRRIDRQSSGGRDAYG